METDFRVGGSWFRRATLKTYPWKSYRLRPTTVALLAALWEALKRRYLSYDELVSELIRFYLSHQRNVTAQVERILRDRDHQADADDDPDPPPPA